MPTEKRVALVVGNSVYDHAPTLANPSNDAAAVSAVLARLGFDVIEGIDLDQRAMRYLLRDFADALDDADVALFYYAGHGLQVAGRNYLVPIDARLERELDLAYEVTELSVVLKIMERSPRTNLVFLDACRDNPLAGNLARSMGAARSQAMGRGLARVESGIGTLIAYATEPGNIALDGKGEHSPFTAALLEHIEKPAIDVGQMLRRVRESVVAATNGRQVPWDHSSLTGDFYFVPKAAAEKAPPAPIPGTNFDTRALELSFWESIKDSDNPARFEAYLAQFPNGVFAALAQIQLDALR